MTINFNPIDDGTTHINCYSKGLTELGRLLSNFARTPFGIIDGIFASIEGYWYWLSIDKDEPLRDILHNLSGFAAKNLGRQLKGNDYPSNNEFQTSIKIALGAKVRQNYRVQLLLRESTLPLVHYYNYGGAIKYDGKSDWVWHEYELIRKRLKGNS